MSNNDNKINSRKSSEIFRNNSKIRYRMFKAGKQWFFASTATLGGIVGALGGVLGAVFTLPNTTHADTDAGATQNVDTGAILATKSSTTIPATSTASDASAASSSASDSASGSDTSSSATNASTANSSAETSDADASTATTSETSSAADSAASSASDSVSSSTASSESAASSSAATSIATSSAADSATSDTTKSTASLATSSAAVSDANVSSASANSVASSDITVINLGDATSEEIVAAKAAALAEYEATGNVQQLVAVAASVLTSGKVAVADDPSYFWFVQTGDGFTLQPSSSTVKVGKAATISSSFSTGLWTTLGNLTQAAASLGTFTTSTSYTLYSSTNGTTWTSVKTNSTGSFSVTPTAAGTTYYQIVASQKTSFNVAFIPVFSWSTKSLGSDVITVTALANEVTATGVSATVDSSQLVYGGTYALSSGGTTISSGAYNSTTTGHATITPTNSTDYVKWSVTSGSSVSVDSTTGVITATGIGNATITATVYDSDGSVVKNSDGTNMTASVDVSVTSGVNDEQVNAGQSATFNIIGLDSSSFDSSQGTISYQWYKNGTAISGATSSTYTLASAAKSDNGNSYTVAVTITDANGISATYTLGPGVLTVNPYSSTLNVIYTTNGTDSDVSAAVSDTSVDSGSTLDIPVVAAPSGDVINLSQSTFTISGADVNNGTYTFAQLQAAAESAGQTISSVSDIVNYLEATYPTSSTSNAAYSVVFYYTADQSAITADNVTVNAGNAYDVSMANATAVNSDGTTGDASTITSTAVDTSTVGTYSATLSYYDPTSFTTINKTITVTVIPANTGSNNTGGGNTGDSNTGNDNSGSNNTGDSNTGNDNSGSNNTGDSNTGNDNSGS
ncbi:KxYKxGKxW signal peptide domain-containing protein, partial [uncultured Lacticaseibacillus sp.]|uniref:KxYKxGKxW signal peptide domain-containing protein n=1 Tax=uncultured Lacticaseibacillus sp. TaxID=2775882 RepID=UPI002595F0D1